jgi:hypothetical protein
MHSGVFNVPCQFEATEVGQADEPLPAEVGHSSARKEMH